MEIDKIMDMLDWHNPDEIQRIGRENAKKIKCINVFILQGHREHNKNVWDNCAKILARRKDEELKPYLFELMRWLEDMNWPGSQCIFQRLNTYERTDYFYWVATTTVCIASRMPEHFWLINLMKMKRLRFRFRRKQRAIGGQ